MNDDVDDSRSAVTLSYAIAGVRPMNAFERLLVSPITWRRAIALPLAACLPVLAIAHLHRGVFNPQSYYLAWIAWAIVTFFGATLVVGPYFAMRADVVQHHGLDQSLALLRRGPAVVCVVLLYTLPVAVSCGALPWIAFQLCRPQFDALKVQAQRTGVPVTVNGYIGPFYVYSVDSELYSDTIIVQLSGPACGDGAGFYWSGEDNVPSVNLGDSWPLFGGWHTFSTD